MYGIISFNIFIWLKFWGRQKSCTWGCAQRTLLHCVLETIKPQKLLCFLSAFLLHLNKSALICVFYTVVTVVQDSQLIGSVAYIAVNVWAVLWWTSLSNLWYFIMILCYTRDKIPNVKIERKSKAVVHSLGSIRLGFLHFLKRINKYIFDNLCSFSSCINKLYSAIKSRQN